MKEQSQVDTKSQVSSTTISAYKNRAKKQAYSSEHVGPKYYQSKTTSKNRKQHSMPHVKTAPKIVKKTTTLKIIEEPPPQ